MPYVMTYQRHTDVAPLPFGTAEAGNDHFATIDLAMAERAAMIRRYPHVTYCVVDSAYVPRLSLTDMAAIMNAPAPVQSVPVPLEHAKLRSAPVDIVRDPHWRGREAHRFGQGQYALTPWHYETWALARHGELFAHLSMKSPGKISFTESADKGERDIQAQGMAPGRFLNKYFSAHLTPCEIEAWTAKVTEAAGLLTLHVTQDADTIEQVYTHGPHSCMSHRASSYAGHCHPTRVYAGPDLAIAYLGEDDDVSSRCVVWPEKQIYGTIYGDESRMRLALDAAGYTNGSLRGARLRRINNENGGGFIMPYIDGSSGASDDGEFLVLDGGGLCTGNTEGATASWTCPHCNDVENEGYSSYIDDEGESWCRHCADGDATHCDLSGNLYADGVERVHGSSQCSYIHENHMDTADIVHVPDRDEYWHLDYVFFCDDCSEAFHVDDHCVIDDGDDASTCTSCGETRQEALDAKNEAEEREASERRLALCA